MAKKKKTVDLFVVSLLAMIILVFGGGNAHGQRTQYDIDREESLRNRQPQVSNFNTLIFFLAHTTMNVSAFIYVCCSAKPQCLPNLFSSCLFI